MTAYKAPSDPLRRACPFCAHRYGGAPSECPRCGTLLGEAAGDLERLGDGKRKLIRSRKALADTLFLVGLLLGGPMTTLGGSFRLGSFIVLAGGAASVLRRHTEWSLPGIVAIGSLVAAVVAALVVEPAHKAVEDTRTGEAARSAFVSALDGLNDDVSMEVRGAGAVVVWFTVPQSEAGECGQYPSAELRAHLADLGFLRVVVKDQNQ
ncbi:MAG: hypothetical protein Q8N53_20400, partial [Longimicrobiales bacterium]|nr:hypothetical protein [Longimicrobiales bacterium]